MVLGDLRAHCSFATGVRETEASCAVAMAAQGGASRGLQGRDGRPGGLRRALRPGPGGHSPPAPTVSRTPLDGDGIDPQAVPLRVALTLGGGPGAGSQAGAPGGGRLVADFGGSSPGAGAINCPLPFTRSVVYACVRCLLGQDLPNNGGYFEPSTSWPRRGRSSTPSPAPSRPAA